MPRRLSTLASAPTRKARVAKGGAAIAAVLLLVCTTLAVTRLESRGLWGSLSHHGVATMTMGSQVVVPCRFFIDTPQNWPFERRMIASRWGGVHYEGPEAIPNTTFYNMQQRSLELFTWQYLVKHPWRSHDKANADVFFVPAYTTCDLWLRQEPENKQCRSDLADAKERSVAAHGNASFSIFSRPNRFYYSKKSHYPLLIRDKGLKATTETFLHRLGKRFINPPWVAVPYISNFLHRNGRFSPPAAAARLHDTPRALLVSGAFHVRGPKNSHRLREKILRDCAARRKFCRVRADDAHGPTDRNLKNQSFLPEVLALYRSSVFTFQPPGDSYARKGIFDSLSQGAIPAIFHPKSFDYPAFFAEPYSELVVLLDPQHDVVDQLLRVPPRDIRRMQRNIREHFHKLFYRDYRFSTPMVSYGGGGRVGRRRSWVDAMEHFLLHCCARARGEPPPNGGKSPEHPGFAYTPKRLRGEGKNDTR